MRITILNMCILRRSNTDHTSDLIDESKPRPLIDYLKPRTITSSNKKIPANIVIETNKTNLAQGEPMKKGSKTTIESCLQQLNNF